jgi:apolipoprotein N-acyltransferase
VHALILKSGRFSLQTSVSLLGAGLLATTILFSGWSLLCLVALVPWAILYGRPGSRAGVLPAAIGTVAYHLAVNHPLMQYGSIAWVILTAEALILYTGALLLLRFTSRRMPSVPIAVRLPVIWTALEWVYVKTEVFRMPVFLLQHALADWPVLIQSADLLGGYSLMIPLAMVNGMLADVVVHLWRQRSPASDGGRGSPGLSPRTLRWTVVATVGAVGFVVVYGLARIDRTGPVPGPRVALIQPAMPHVIGWPEPVHVEQLYRTARDVPEAAADLVIWPENSIMDFYDRPNRYLDDMTWLARTKQTHVLFGAIGRAKVNPFRTTSPTPRLTSSRGRSTSPSRRSCGACPRASTSATAAWC